VSNPFTRPALLLLGPTGAGKSPLGHLLVQNGLAGRTCAHFDFGERLRAVVNREDNGTMSDDDVSFLSSVLASGALLENETFFLAQKIIDRFNRDNPADIVILNGLPRHDGQAADVERSFDVRMVCFLRCSAQTVAERIRQNSGGDRTGRTDDDLDLMAQKLRTFHQRTEPLIERYGAKGIPVMTFDIEVDTTSRALFDALSTRVRFFKSSPF